VKPELWFVALVRGEQDGSWEAEKVLQIPGKTVDNWALPTMPGLSMYL